MTERLLDYTPVQLTGGELELVGKLDAVIDKHLSESNKSFNSNEALLDDIESQLKKSGVETISFLAPNLSSLVENSLDVNRQNFEYHGKAVINNEHANFILRYRIYQKKDSMDYVVSLLAIY